MSLPTDLDTLDYASGADPFVRVAGDGSLDLASGADPFVNANAAPASVTLTDALDVGDLGAPFLRVSFDASVEADRGAPWLHTVTEVAGPTVYDQALTAGLTAAATISRVRALVKAISAAITGTATLQADAELAPATPQEVAGTVTATASITRQALLIYAQAVTAALTASASIAKLAHRVKSLAATLAGYASLVPGDPNITHVETVYFEEPTAFNVSSAPSPAFDLAGGELIVVDTYCLADDPVITISDTLGNEYVARDHNRNDPANRTIRQFYCINALPGTDNVVTMQLSVARRQPSIGVSIYRYHDTAFDAFEDDGVSNESVSNTTMIGPAVAITWRGLVHTLMTTNVGSALTITDGASVARYSANSVLICDRIEASGGTYNSEASLSFGGNQTISSISFRGMPLPPTPLALTTATVALAATMTRFKGFAQAVAAALTASGVLDRTLAISRTLTGALTATASRLRALNRTRTATTTATATVSRQRSLLRTVAAAVTPTATLAKGLAYAREVAADLALTGVVAYILARELLAEVVASATVSRLIARLATLTASLTATASRSRGIAKTLARSLTVTASRRNSHERALAAAAAADAAMVRSFPRDLSGEVTASASLSRLRTLLQAVAATVTATASRSRTISLIKAAAVTLTATRTRLIDHGVSASLVATAHLLRNRFQTLAADLLTLTASMVRALPTLGRLIADVFIVPALGAARYLRAALAGDPSTKPAVGGKPEVNDD